ncbi:MAG: MBL fold metallo-hydrolase [Clostridia bacterium]|nr:MBL fold metallo-hydrolase [Clostridia bacterium]
MREKDSDIMYEGLCCCNKAAGLCLCSISSGSSGNCYLVRSATTAILVDAGISGKKVLNGISKAGTEPEEIKGLLITHEHVDHIKSVKVLTKKLPNMKVFSNAHTWEFLEDAVPVERGCIFRTGEAFSIGDIEVMTFHVSHDAAEPVGYSFRSGSSQISIVTDTGCVTDEIYNEIRYADLLVLEANHEEGLVHMCRYPYQIKRRILSKLGHLSNAAAGELLCRVMQETKRSRPLQVLLAHLSSENNTPALARMTVKNILEEHNYREGRDIEIDVLVKDAVSDVYETGE